MFTPMQPSLPAIQARINFTGRQKELRTQRQQIQQQLVLGVQTANADKTERQVKKVVEFGQKDFGNGVTGKKVLMALYLVFTQPRNWLSTKINPEKTFKLKDNLDSYFIPEQQDALRKAFEDLSDYKTHQVHGKPDLLFNTFIKHIRVGDSYGSYSEYSIKIKNAQITPEQQNVIKAALTELGVLENNGDVNFNFNEGYTTV